MADRKPGKRKIRTASVILIFGFGVLLLFTGIMIWLLHSTGASPDTLITCFFGFWGAEFLGMLVKRVMDKREAAQARRKQTNTTIKEDVS